jgi:hypothetical protein
LGPIVSKANDYCKFRTLIEKPKDPVSAMLLEEQVVRESIIAHEEINKLREKVQECYWREGVNHLENW